LDVYKKKQKNIVDKSSESNYAGDAWVYTAIKRGTYFIIAFSIGKHNTQTCRELMNILFDTIDLPFPENKIVIFTDGNDQYETCLRENYADTCIDYGQLIKIRKKGRVVEKKKRIIIGNPDLNDIETTDVENANGIFRERVGRLVRKTKCFSKVTNKLEHAIVVFQFYWNFINLFNDNKTPAMLEDIVEQPDTWEIFLNTAIKYV